MTGEQQTRLRGNGTMAFVGISAVVAILSGMAALWRPLSDRQRALEATLSDHTNPERHALSHAQRLDRLEAWRENWILTVPALDATQNSKIATLEREIFGVHQGDPP